MYELLETDLAGNCYPIASHPSLDYICEQAIVAKRIKPQNVYTIINPDRVDVGDPTGLTEEEQELVP